MMNTHNKGGTRLRPNLDTMKLVLTGLALLLSPYVALTQTTNVQTYHFDDDVKLYSTEMDIVDQYSVMAGTVFTTTGGGDPIQIIHFLRLDPLGAVDGVSVVYDDPDFTQERVVDIVKGLPGTNGEYYIIASVRPDNGSTYTKDMIKILKVDRDGAIMDDQLIDGYIGSPTDYNCVYPTHGIFDIDNNILYICGFITTDTELPNYPDYPDNKQAVVLRIDVTTSPNYTITHAQAYDYVYNPAPGGTNDYDMALRMHFLNHNGDIFVTGSTNAVINAGGSNIYHSGVMSLELDNTNLSVNYNKPFCSGQNAYGVGLVQKYNPPPGPVTNYYHLVLGNTFEIIDADITSFKTYPAFFFMNAIKQDLDYFTSAHPLNKQSWMQFHGFDYAWLLQEVVTEQQGNSTNLVNFTAAGMQSNDDGCSSPATTVDNVNPFLYSAQISWNNGIVGNISVNANEKWTTYLNQAGTGQQWLAPNSYWDLGGGLSNIGWHPTFAAFDPGTDGVVMSAPRYDTDITDLLHLKYIRTNDKTTNYDVPDCPGSYIDLTTQSPNCWPPDFFTTYASDPFTGSIALDKYVTTYTTSVYVGASNDDGYNWTEHDCSSAPLSPVFRTAGVESRLAENLKVNIHPNPASSYIEVKLKSDIDPDAEVQIKLMNMLGQEVARLYNGSVVTLNGNNKLPLPYVSRGIYMVQVWNKNQMLTQQKLSIQ